MVEGWWGNRTPTNRIEKRESNISAYVTINFDEVNYVYIWQMCFPSLSAAFLPYVAYAAYTYAKQIFDFFLLFCFTIYVVVCLFVCVGERFRISISSASIWQRNIEQYKQTLPKVIPIISVCFGRQKHYNRIYDILRLLLLVKIGFVVKYDIVLQSLCLPFRLEWQRESV